MMALDETEPVCEPGRIIRLEQHLGDAMALFGRRERREVRRGAVHYRIREKLVAIGDDYWLEDDAGQRVFKVNGKALRVRDTLIFEDD